MNISEVKLNAEQADDKVVQFSFKNESGRVMHGTIDIEKDEVTVHGIGGKMNAASFEFNYGKYKLVPKDAQEEVLEEEVVAEETPVEEATAAVEETPLVEVDPAGEVVDIDAAKAESE